MDEEYSGQEHAWINSQEKIFKECIFYLLVLFIWVFVFPVKHNKHQITYSYSTVHIFHFIRNTRR
jgi:formate hydrogenlyase subunit 4